MQSCAIDKHQLAAEIKQKARSLGFDLVGISSAEPSTRREYLRQWLDDGKAGVMDYLQRRFDERTDPASQLVNGRIERRRARSGQTACARFEFVFCGCGE